MPTKTLVEDVFTYEVDSSQRSHPPVFTRSQFWDHAYVERGPEEKAYVSFLKSNSDLLCISGHVGAGKTTYLLRNLERSGACHGLYVDFRGYAAALQDQEPSKDVDERRIALRVWLRSIIGNHTKEVLIQNCLRRRPDEALDRDLVFSEDVRSLTRAEATTTARRRAERRLVVEALMRLHPNERLDGFRNTIEDDFESDDALRKAFDDRLAKGTQRGRILEALTWLDWISLYQCLFSAQTPNSVIALDNVDALDIRHLQRVFVSVVLEIHSEINQRPNLGAWRQRSAPNIRIVFAVRDENLERLDVWNAQSQRYSQIALGGIKQDHFRHRVGDRYVIENRAAWLGAVTRQRLEWLETRGWLQDEEATSFATVVRDIWLQAGGSVDLAEEISHLNIFRLGNLSTRLILDLVFSTSWGLVGRARQRGYSPRSLLTRYGNTVVRSIVVRQWFGAAGMRDIRELLREEMRKEQSGDFCCSLRMLLTWISGQTGPTKVGSLVRRFRDVFAYSDEEILESLFRLYGASGAGRFVKIYQPALILEAQDIDEDALVFVTPQGEESLRMPLTSVDSFACLLGSNVGLDSEVLGEQLPSDAVKYCAEVYRLGIRNLGREHLRHWSAIVCSRFADYAGLPFQKYEEFTVGKALFLERAATSHRDQILGYLFELLRGPECELVWSEGRREWLRSEIGSNRVPGLTRSAKDFYEQIAVAIGEFPANHDVRGLWELALEYGAAVRALQSFRNRSFSELKGGAVPDDWWEVR